MSESANTAQPAVPAPFLLRRLHSLAGIIPIGAFLCIHLTTNASIVWGRLGHGGVETFQHEVNFIHSTPFLLLIEVFGLWLPIGFHAVLGFYYAFTGSSNVAHYGYGANWRYTLQRLTGYFGFIFILYHVATLRWGWTWLPFASGFDAHTAASSTAQAIQGGADTSALGGFLIGALYLIGVLALIYHLANGLWTAAITWGLTISAGAQRRWGFVCSGAGLALAALGVMAFVGFVTLDLEAARQTESRLHSEIVNADTPQIAPAVAENNTTTNQSER
ncbi:MAG: succinate dehydrogenase [Phycisphaeraceae bacterium]|nr:succinate dehydrogenase [Phycisphaeraceae bacterium]MCB9848102.1 succinate dehydrogenase [Phycisphaeraceae bacterium]